MAIVNWDNTSCMKAVLFVLFVLFSFNFNTYAQEAAPPGYLREFMQKVLLPMLPKHGREKNMDPYRLKLIEEDSVHIIRLEVLIPEAKKNRSEWNVFSKYQFVFLDNELQRKEPASVRVHRLMNRSEYLGPSIEGQLIVNYHMNALAEPSLLPGLVRSLFRADYTLHQMFKNPFLPAEKQVKNLTPSQIKALAGDKDNNIPGLITMYKDFRSEMQSHPMHAALMLPTGNGKSIVAIKYLELVKMLHNGQTPKVLFLVENKIILADIVQKLLEQFPGAKIATLFGQSTNMAIAPDTQFILATRSTGFRRQVEILDFLSSKGGPKVIFRDESHHTGKVGGQFASMLVSIMNIFGSDTQVIDMSATPWHDDAPDLIKQYQGRVATTFVTFDEYQKLIAGQQVDRIARLQLVRAILDGWLAPLDNLTFVTQGSESEASDISFRARLLREQYEMLDRLGLNFNDETMVNLNELSAEDVSFLKDEIKKVHEPIVKELLKDLRNQILRDRSGKVAEYDRGIIFVPSILHAEAYQFILSEMTGDNMEFRVVHSKQSRTIKTDVVEENIDWFNGTRDIYKHKYLISVDMLREGVDIPVVNRIVSVTTSESIKVLLQMFGRATRLSPLKSGIRLTDFGGSFLKFFQEIPGSLLKTLFPLYENQFVDKSSFMSFEDAGKDKSGVVVNGKSIKMDDLQFVQLSTPMQELAYVGDRDEARLRKATLNVLKNHLAIFEQHEKLYSWSLETESVESSEISAWLNEWLDWDIYKKFSTDTSKVNSGAYEASRSFNKDNHISDLDASYKTSKGDYRRLSQEDLNSLSVFINEAELFLLSEEDQKSHRPTDYSQALPLQLLTKALELVSLKSSALTFLGVPLGYLNSSAVEAVAKKMSPYALFSLYLLQLQMADGDIKGTNIYKLLIQQETDRRYEFFKNREAVLHFAGANWRWLSLPWKYLLDDINVEKFFHTGGHPLQETYDKLIADEGGYIERLKGLGYLRVIDALQDGYFEFLPSEVKEGLTNALKQEPELLAKLVAQVNLYSLVFTDEGQDKILSAPRGLEFIHKYDKRPRFNRATPYSWLSDENRIQESDRIWFEDYRWAKTNPIASDIFETIDQPRDLFEVRQKSLYVGTPYSGPESRKGLSFLRLLSLAKNLPYETDERSKLKAVFHQADIETDNNLGLVSDADRSKIVNGVFAPNRTWAINRNLPFEMQERYSENRFLASEEALMFEALRIEAAERRLPLHEYKGRNYITVRALSRAPLPPILFSDLLESAKDLKTEEIQNAFRYYMLNTSRINIWESTSHDQKLVSWNGVFSVEDLMPVVLQKTNGTSLWMDHFDRILFNPNSFSLNYEDQIAMAKILGTVGQALLNPTLGIDQSVKGSQDWLLSIVPNSDLPFAMNNEFNKRLGGVFQQPRFFMALPYYYSMKYKGNAFHIAGVGKHRNELLAQWAPIFEKKYASELKQLNFDRFFDLSDDLFAYIHQKYINNIANSNSSFGATFKPHEMDLNEFESKIRQQGDAFLAATGIYLDFKKTKGLDFEWFKKHIRAEVVDALFKENSYAKQLSPWDNLLSYILGLELSKVSERIQAQRGSLQTYSLMRTNDPSVDFSDDKSEDTIEVGSCTGFLQQGSN